MADTKLSAIATNTTITGTTRLYSVAGTTTGYSTINDMLTYFGANLGSVNGLTVTSSTGTLTVAASKTLTVSNSITLTGTDGVSLNVSNIKKKNIGFTSSGTIATGKQKGYAIFPVAGTITGWSIMADAGTCTVRVWKIAAGTAVPTVANNINTSGVALATGTAIKSTTVTDFTSTAVTAGDMFAFEITATSGQAEVSFNLEISVT